MRSNAVRSDCRRYDERFRVVNHQRRKRILGTFHDHFFAIAEVQDLHAAICRVRNMGVEPVPSRLNKLAMMQSSSFFQPAVAGINWFNQIH